MSLIRLANGHKYEIEQPNEGEGMLRNRKRSTVQITFRAGAEQFDAIRADIISENLESFRIYYPDNETADEPDEQLEGVSNKLFEAFSLVAIGRIKKSSCRKKPARPRLYTDASCPLRSENDWQAIHDRSAPLGRFLIL